MTAARPRRHDPEVVPCNTPEFNTITCRPRCEPPQCLTDRPVSEDHYATIQDYQDIDVLIKPTPVDQDPYLTPVEYDCAAAAAPASCGTMSYDLLDPNQTDNGHIYVRPAKAGQAGANKD